MHVFSSGRPTQQLPANLVRIRLLKEAFPMTMKTAMLAFLLSLLAIASTPQPIITGTVAFPFPGQFGVVANVTGPGDLITFGAQIISAGTAPGLDVRITVDGGTPKILQVANGAGWTAAARAIATKITGDGTQNMDLITLNLPSHFATSLLVEGALTQYSSSQVNTSVLVAK
jgi:hypothetical protein